jgi:N4-(beta-N-acetylglucosaminyl)-L-asparaginase
MQKRISRRHFFNRSFGLGAGALLWKSLPVLGAGNRGTIPLIITSHTNRTGQNAMEKGWKVLTRGGSALDAVEKAANVIEVDPEDSSVGYGGLPNEEGVVQLDASIMDGKTYNAGSVACLENIRTPSSLARIVMERTDHVLLVGSGALEFARKWGFKEENLLTEKARKRYIQWKERLNEKDDWGPPDHLRDVDGLRSSFQRENEVEHHYGTTNVLAVDSDGDIAGITSTSGLSWKIAGRVGDSPIIGAGLYVDNDVGAAGATGRGEDVMKSCASYFIVLRMKQGRSPQQACYDALEMIVDKYKKVNPDFFPGEKFVAINRDGECGCASMTGRTGPEMTVMNAKGIHTIQGITFKK